MEGSHRGDKLKPILYPPRQTMTTSQTYESERLQGYEKCEEYKMSCSVARSDLFFNLFKLDSLLNVMGGRGVGGRDGENCTHLLDTVQVQRLQLVLPIDGFHRAML